MPIVALQVKNNPEYPHSALTEGLHRAGYTIYPSYPYNKPDKTILLITWTLWSGTTRRKLAEVHRKAGGRIICMENAWLPSLYGEYWQVAERKGLVSGINGSGVFPAPEDNSARWRSFGVNLKPWRTSGSHILVCPQRGVKDNDPDITHGKAWTEQVMGKIRALTDRPVLWRPHPGAPGKATLPDPKWHDVTIMDPARPLIDGMKDAWACVVYSSTSATEAIINGIPVLYDGPHIMCSKLASDLRRLENPRTPDREPVLHQLAYYQWSTEELRRGKPWKYFQ